MGDRKSELVDEITQLLSKRLAKAVLTSELDGGRSRQKQLQVVESLSGGKLFEDVA